MSGYETDHAALAANRVALANSVIGTKPQLLSRVGSGIIVGRRTKGRLFTSGKPFEHVNVDAALDEANRLAGLNPGTEFVVLTVVETVLNDRVKSTP